MSWNEKNDAAGDAALEDALKNFRQSVHAWSDAAYSRPRPQVQIAAHRSWRLAAVWALGCSLVVGSLSAGFYEHRHREVLAQIKAAQEARQRQLAAQQPARMSDEDLLAEVDSDVARTVPAAMEPLAQMMDENESK